MNYTYFSGTSRSYIDHIFVSENTVNQLNNCTILPHHVDNVGDHLPLKVNISLSCKPSCTSSGDVTLCRQIKNRLVKTEYKGTICGKYKKVHC